MPYSPREVMTKAWVAARKAARGFGGRPAQYLREALRQVWFAARPVAARVAIMNARVVAEMARIAADAATRPVAAAYVLPPRRFRAFTARRAA